MGRRRDDGMPNSLCRLKAVMGRGFDLALLTLGGIQCVGDILLPLTVPYIYLCICFWLDRC